MKYILGVILIFVLGYLIIYGDCVFISTIVNFNDIEIASLTLGTVIKLFLGLYSILITLGLICAMLKDIFD